MEDLIMKKTNKNNTTELVFILDRSGSMAGLEADTIGGFNSMIEKQKNQDGKCYVSTVLFDDRIEVVHDRVELHSVNKMTEDDYFVRGCTALIDAIGSSIRHIANIHKYARPEDVPQNTMFVITTDGMENASHQFSSDEVKRMIKKEKEKYGWEFIFIGANIDAVETAKQFGIGSDRAVNYHADSKGTEVLYNTVSQVVSNVRMCAPMQTNWSDNINKDFKSRNKRR
ncbi:MAG: VWA domain-containing protein [Acutalibacteraceae bacterium]|nr:VWA domain-containing protein [Acutalibacteraceae bacterium]